MYLFGLANHSVFLLLLFSLEKQDGRRKGKGGQNVQGGGNRNQSYIKNRDNFAFNALLVYLSNKEILLPY